MNPGSKDKVNIDTSGVNTSVNKFGHKSYNYHSNFVQSTDSKTPSNSNVNVSIKYQLMSKANSKPKTKVTETKNRKAKSMQSYRLQVAKNKQKLTRDKIKFKGIFATISDLECQFILWFIVKPTKVGKNFGSKAGGIGKAMPPKTQRELQSFMYSHNKGDQYSWEISALGKSSNANK